MNNFGWASPTPEKKPCRHKMRNLIFLNCGTAAISLAQRANIAALKAQFLARRACT